MKKLQLSQQKLKIDVLPENSNIDSQAPQSLSSGPSTSPQLPHDPCQWVWPFLLRSGLLSLLFLLCDQTVSHTRFLGPPEKENKNSIYNQDKSKQQQHKTTSSPPYHKKRLCPSRALGTVLSSSGLGSPSVHIASQACFA